MTRNERDVMKIQANYRLYDVTCLCCLLGNTGSFLRDKAVVTCSWNHASI